MSEVLGKKMDDQIVPEFPLRVGTLYPDRPGNRSCKVDYLALSCDRTLAVFVELKTDGASRRAAQDDYLQRASALQFNELLDGVVQLVRASNQKHKYCHLLGMLRRLDLLKLPPEIEATLNAPHWASAINACLGSVRATSIKPERRVMYLAPDRKGPNDIAFATFAAWLAQRDDPVALRFAQSLNRWATVRAGRGD